jgi:uncharacterized protein (TIRG00374 family)
LQGAAQVASVISERQTSQRKSGYPYWKWPIVIGLSVFLLYLALRGVEWRRVGNIVAHCRVSYLILACSCGALSYIVRAMRWRILLSAKEKLAYTTVLWASSVGYLANNYLPARAGELVRTAMISSRSRLSKTYVFTTAMTERVIEFVILVLMAFFLSLTLPQRPVWLVRLMLLTTVSALAATAFFLLLPRVDRARTGLVTRLPVSGRTKDRLHGIAESVTLALIALRDPLRLFQVCGATTIVWTLDAAAAVILARALGMHLLFSVAVLLSTGLAIGNALPSTPGAVGIFQFAAVTVLTPFNYTQTEAIAYILVAQAAGYVVITTLGLIGLWRYRLTGTTETGRL